MYLAKESIEFGYEAADWRDAVRQAGKLLLNAGAITESYIDAMINMVEAEGAYMLVAPGVAMPHARPQDGALKNGISYAMKMDEGRTVEGLANCAAPNYLEDTSNAEVCAAFGCDVVFLDGHNPDNVVFPGLPSKNPEDDTPYKFLTTGIGKGWSVRDVRTLIGRPLACGLYIDPDCSGNLNKVKYNGVYASRENIEKVIEEGFDIIGVYGWAKPEILVDLVKSVADQINGRAVFEVGFMSGPGANYLQDIPYDMRKLFDKELAAKLVKNGAQIVHMPGVGTFPGFDMKYIGDIIDAVHEERALASIGVHSAQEGADVNTIRRIAIDNKLIGADIQVMGDTGVNNGMALPETLQAMCVALKGHRHVYRRLCESVMR